MKFTLGLAFGFAFMVIWIYLCWKVGAVVEFITDWLHSLRYR